MLVSFHLVAMDFMPRTAATLFYNASLLFFFTLSTAYWSVHMEPRLPFRSAHGAQNSFQRCTWCPEFLSEDSVSNQQRGAFYKSTSTTRVLASRVDKATIVRVTDTIHS